MHKPIGVGPELKQFQISKSRWKIGNMLDFGQGGKQIEALLFYFLLCMVFLLYMMSLYQISSTSWAILGISICKGLLVSGRWMS